MLVHGWCERCRKVKRVRVKGAGMGALIKAGVATGVCPDCEKK